MAGRAHKEQQGQSEPGADLRYQERLPGHALRLFWNGRGLLGEGPRPQNDSFLDAPHDAPYVQQQHPADAAANADGQQPVALPAVIVKVDVQAAGRSHVNGHQDGQHQTFVQWPFQRHDQAVFDGKSCRPDKEKTPDGRSRGSLSVAGVGGDNHHPVSNPCEDGDQRAPAEPPHRAAEQRGRHLGPSAGIHLFHDWSAHQVEKVKQPDPGDAGQEMDPAQNDLGGGGGAGDKECSEQVACHGGLRACLWCCRRPRRSSRLYKLWRPASEVENCGPTPYRTGVPCGLVLSVCFLTGAADFVHAHDSPFCHRRGLAVSNQRRSQMESKPAQNIQDSFLNTARKDKTAITLYLLSGVKLTGRIRSFDKYSLVLETGNQEQLIFKHAISTVVMPKTAHVERPASSGEAKPAQHAAADVATAGTSSGTEG